ncbi:MAG: hypothetical protein OXH38_09840 [Chloroflexi bacterium]|nr:hypothetical protein [Chloroflexota bacterium]
MTESGGSVDRVSIPSSFLATGNQYGDASYYATLFATDVAEHLFPISGDLAYEPVFQLSSHDEHVGATMESAFHRYGSHGGYGQSLSAILSEFGNRTAQRLVLSGFQALEIAPTIDANARPIGFSVLRINGARNFAGFTWQVIPKDTLVGTDLRNLKPANQRLIRIPRNRVVRMRLPRRYRGIPGGLEALGQMGGAVPDFVIRSLHPNQTHKVPYDLEELKGIEQRAVASITKSTGWSGRWAFDDAVTRYYTMRRFLRFEEFKVRLREAVADTINRILTVAGASVGFAAKISLHHLPRLEEIEDSRSDLAAGRLGYREMLDRYSIHR